MEESVGVDRAAVQRELQRLALGEADLSGRQLSSRITALKTLERWSRPDDRPAREAAVHERHEWPVDERGVFDPSARPEFWPLRLSWRWTAGSERERMAVADWRASEHFVRWEASGSPWSRTEWEADPTPWRDALAALGG